MMLRTCLRRRNSLDSVLLALCCDWPVDQSLPGWRTFSVGLALLPCQTCVLHAVDV